MNYADETLKAKYARTAFAFLFEPRHKPQPPMTKELEAKARKKAHNDRHNAARAARAIKADKKQKAK